MGEASTLESRVAAAQAMSQPGAAPAAKPAPATEASARAESAATEGADAATEQPEGATESPAESSGDDAGTTESLTPEERVDAAGKALEKGDLKGLAKALGKDIKVPDGSLRAFRSLSRREGKLKADREKWEKDRAEHDSALEKAKREIAEDSAKNSRLLRHVEQTYGWIPKAQQAWDEGDMVAFGKAIERMGKGASLATITQRLAGIKTGDAPTQRAPASDPEKEQLKARLAEVEREKAQEKAEREKAQNERSLSERRDGRKAEFGKALAKHPFLANPDEPGKVDADALEEAFKAYEASWDPGAKRFTKSAKQVVDELHARELRRLKRLGLAPAAQQAPAPASSRPNPDKKVTPPAKKLPEPPRTSGNGKTPNLEDTRAARMALARRMTEQQLRGAR